MSRIQLVLLLALSILIATGAYAPAFAEIESGTLRTSDNISIAYERYKNGFNNVIIVCPGFYNSERNRWMQKTAELLSSSYDVIVFDFRGHGMSGGKFTWSAKERLDLEAVLDYAKSCGYKGIGVTAFSLGAATAVDTAAERNDIDSMVLFSCPSKINMIDFHFWEPAMLSDLKDNMDCGWEGKGVRTGNPFMKKNDPVDIVGRIKNTPILFIHGDDDWIVKPRHSRELYAAAHVEKKLELVKGGLHAERLIQADPEGMKKLMLDWFSKRLK
ncbi:MAG: alpha/beta hydrolase [Candidatus Omnitrophica bacterium]|nr:alpha/beta hydrolase [Candidatus Omnitrophota bacterium]